MYTITVQHRCMSLKVDVSWTKLIYVIFEFVLLRITIIYLTKHRCIHVRNFVRIKLPYESLGHLWFKRKFGGKREELVRVAAYNVVFEKPCSWVTRGWYNLCKAKTLVCVSDQRSKCLNTLRPEVSMIVLVNIECIDYSWIFDCRVTFPVSRREVFIVCRSWENSCTTKAKHHLESFRISE